MRRVLSEYELSTSQDLLSLAHWLAQELKAIPTEALNQSLSYLTEGKELLQLSLNSVNQHYLRLLITTMYSKSPKPCLY